MPESLVIERLFVYGSLAPGRANAHVLADLRGTWEPASVTGTLRQQGWGAAIGFPGIVLDAGGDEVIGQVFTSEDLPRHWARLDTFEGEGYRRVPAIVRLQDGREVEAYIYCLAGSAD